MKSRTMGGDDMGLFDRFYYGKAGKRDYSEADMPTNRVSLFFMVFKDRFFDLIKVNLLQLVFWIPLILWTMLNLLVVQSADSWDGITNISGALSGYILTWLIGLVPCILITGPSSAGSAYVMRNWAKDQHAFLLSDFKDAFKSNWKQALAVSAMTAFLPVIIYAAFVFYGDMAKGNPILYLPLAATLSAGLIAALMHPLIYPMIVGYELKLKDVFKNAFLMSAVQLPKMILIRLITFIPIGIFIFALWTGNWIVLLIVVLYYCLIGFALSRLIYASVANGVFDLYLNPRIEGAAVREGLRPKDWDDETDEDEEDADE